MSEILEVHWGAELEGEIARWLVERGQLRQPTAADMSTPEMVELACRNRRMDARQAVRELRTVLNARAVKVIDLELHERVQGLRDGARKGAETQSGSEGGTFKEMSPDVASQRLALLASGDGCASVKP